MAAMTGDVHCCFMHASVPHENIEFARVKRWRDYGLTKLIQRGPGIDEGPLEVRAGGVRDKRLG